MRLGGLHASTLWVSAASSGLTVVRGHLQYFGVLMNMPALFLFWSQVGWLWHRALSRRSQNGYVDWNRMRRLVDAGCPLCLSIILILWTASLALLPEARAGRGNPARPDARRGSWVTMIPTPTTPCYHLTATTPQRSESCLAPRDAVSSTAIASKRCQKVKSRQYR